MNLVGYCYIKGYTIRSLIKDNMAKDEAGKLLGRKV